MSWPASPHLALTSPPLPTPSESCCPWRVIYIQVTFWLQTTKHDQAPHQSKYSISCALPQLKSNSQTRYCLGQKNRRYIFCKFLHACVKRQYDQRKSDVCVCVDMCAMVVEMLMMSVCVPICIIRKHFSVINATSMCICIDILHHVTVANSSLKISEGCRVGLKPGSHSCRRGEPVSVALVYLSFHSAYGSTRSDVHYAWASCGDRSTPKEFPWERCM